MDGIITLDDNTCAKILSDEDFKHYKKLLKFDYVQTHHPKVLSIKKYEHYGILWNIIIMEKKGIPLSECDNHIIHDAQTFVYEYLDELHKNDCYHGDLVRMGGCGIHLDNVLYNECEGAYYIIDFNSKNTVDCEIDVKRNSQSYCKNNLRKKKKPRTSENSETHSIGRALSFI
jgi:hypothetical protein